MTLPAFRKQLNEWGRDKVPFLFMVDFELDNPQAWPIDQLDANAMLFNFNGKGNGVSKVQQSTGSFEAEMISFSTFKEKFDRVMGHLNRGDSFLTNLTFKTSIHLANNLKDLYHRANAQYKLWWMNRMLFFSPEPFIQISNGSIFTFPMKGTIDAAIPDAKNLILADQKELAEHITIVDLLRNDLSLVATEVEVNRFRYVDEIKTSNKTILQVSSEITGKLPEDYHEHLGDILFKLLPAGSISGAPKPMTLKIIREVEGEPRGLYTGVAGYFDGNSLDSCVMIRFIEQSGNNFYYRSGGGITSQSDPEKEYRETLDKIYVPSL